MAVNNSDVVRKIGQRGNASSNPYFQQFYVINLLDKSSISFYCVPEQFSEQFAAKFSNTDLMGGTNSFFGYDGTDNPSVSFTLGLHDDYCGLGIKWATNYLKSLVYPSYAGRIVAPTCKVVMGNQVTFKGICESVNVDWQLPLRDGAYVRADVNLSFKIVFDKSPSYLDIKGGKIL